MATIAFGEPIAEVGSRWRLWGGGSGVRSVGSPPAGDIQRGTTLGAPHGDSIVVVSVVNASC